MSTQFKCLLLLRKCSEKAKLEFYTPKIYKLQIPKHFLSTILGKYPILQKALSVSLHICSKGTFCRLQYDFYILYVQFFKVNHILPTSILNNKCFNILKSCYLLFHSIKIIIQTIVYQFNGHSYIIFQSTWESKLAELFFKQMRQ